MLRECTRSCARTVTFKSSNPWERQRNGSLNKIAEAYSTPVLLGWILLTAFFFRALVCFLQVFASFFQGSKRVVVRLQGLPILPHSSLALTCDIEDFP